jgi:hypothetical protein
MSENELLELVDDINSVKSVSSNRNYYDTGSIISENSIVSNNSTISNLSVNTCRICLDEVTTIKYFCDCTGTVSVIHEECLLKWINTNNIEACEICKSNYSIHKKRHILWNKIVSYILFIIILAAFYLLIFVRYNNNLFLFIISIFCIISLCVAITYLNYNMFIRYTIVLHELYDNALDSNNNRNSNNRNNNNRNNNVNSNTLLTTNDETIPLIYT